MLSRSLPLMTTLLLSTLLAACGLETATTAATVGVAKVKELEQAKATQQRVVQQLDQSLRDGAARLEKAESGQ